MNGFQLILTFNSAIFFTVSVYYFLRFVFVYKKINEFFYYSLSTFGASIYAIFELVLTCPLTESQLLLFHRLRMVALLVCATFWLFCVFEKFFKDSRLPKFFFIISILIGLTIPSDYFLSTPVRHLQVVFAGIEFNYHFGQIHIFYSLYSVILLSFFTITMFKAFSRRLTWKERVLVVLACLPVIIGGLNDFAVSHGYLTNILIAEYVVCLYLIATFTWFLLEDQKTYDRLKNINQELERMVAERTGQLRQANAELERTNAALTKANELKSELLGIVAHDLKNPLTTIIGGSELLSRSSTDEKIRKYSSLIFHSSNQMLVLINELLESASIESGRVELNIRPLDLGRLATALAEEYQDQAARKDQELRLEAEEGCWVNADEGRIEETMGNLLSNALKYAPPRTTIRMRVRRCDAHIRFEVQDEGPGISNEDQKKLFGKFQRLSNRPSGGEPSTGLGLFIVKQLVDLHGGGIIVDSEPGRGSTFTVLLPAADPPA